MSLQQSSKQFQLVALLLLIFVNTRSSEAETSGEYLQKVMIELQELNVPSSSAAMHDQLSTNLNYQHAGYQNDHSQNNARRKLGFNSAHQTTDQDVQKPIASVTVAQKDKTPVTNIVQYYAVREREREREASIKLINLIK